MSPTKKFLGEFEQIVIAAILRLGDEGYGVAIIDEIAAHTGRDVRSGALSLTLDRMERKGFVGSTLGDPSESRGGRSRRYIRLTPEGLALALVLLVTCANVTNLLFVRGETRRGEIAVRTALGAGRSRVYRQLLTESLVFGVLGGVAGAALGVIGLDVLMALVGDTLPAGFSDRIALDGGVLLFTAGISIGTAVLAGLVLARRTSSPNVGDSLRDGSRTVRSGGPARSALIGVEVALSVVLLVGAGLFIRSLSNLQNVDKGFDGADVVTVRVQVPSARYDSRELWDGFHADLREGIQALPGVQAGPITSHCPETLGRCCTGTRTPLPTKGASRFSSRWSVRSISIRIRSTS